jgi:hypothetical protein
MQDAALHGAGKIPDTAYRAGPKTSLDRRLGPSAPSVTPKRCGPIPMNALLSVHPPAVPLPPALCQPNPSPAPVWTLERLSNENLGKPTGSHSGFSEKFRTPRDVFVGNMSSEYGWWRRRSVPAGGVGVSQRDKQTRLRPGPPGSEHGTFPGPWPGLMRD